MTLTTRRIFWCIDIAFCTVLGLIFLVFSFKTKTSQTRRISILCIISLLLIILTAVYHGILSRNKFISKLIASIGYSYTGVYLIILYTIFSQIIESYTQKYILGRESRDNHSRDNHRGIVNNIKQVVKLGTVVGIWFFVYGLWVPIDILNIWYDSKDIKSLYWGYVAVYLFTNVVTFAVILYLLLKINYYWKIKKLGNVFKEHIDDDTTQHRQLEEISDIENNRESSNERSRLLYKEEVTGLITISWRVLVLFIIYLVVLVLSYLLKYISKHYIYVIVHEIIGHGLLYATFWSYINFEPIENDEQNGNGNNE